MSFQSTQQIERWGTMTADQAAREAAAGRADFFLAREAAAAATATFEEGEDVAPMEEDTEMNARLTAMYQRQFPHRPMRVLIEERPMYTKYNMVGAELYRTSRQQEQVYYGPPRAHSDPVTGTPLDYNHKLVVAQGMDARGRGEFQERLLQLDLEETMRYNRGSVYLATVDPALQRQQIEGMRAFARARAEQSGTRARRSADILFGGEDMLGGQHASRAFLLKEGGRG